MSMNFKTYHYTRTETGSPWFCCNGHGAVAPPELKLERPIRPDIAKRCSYILRGHIRGGSYVSFTGLQSTQWGGIFTGDLLLPMGKSFIIAEIGAEKLTLHVAEKIRVFPRSRNKVVATFLNQKPRAI